MVSIQKRVLRTSLRSDAQATDSTWRGVEGEEGGHESALPEGLRHSVENQEKQDGVQDVDEDVHQVMSAGVQAEELQSNMWEIQVRGCQLWAWVDVKAQRRFSSVIPVFTWGFSVM